MRQTRFRLGTALVSAWIFGIAAGVPAGPAGFPPEEDLLHRPLEEGQAVIWYLGHAGWAVRTRSVFMVFDYTTRNPAAREGSLEHGVIDPEEVRDQKVLVFVSHAHGDHWDPAVLEWKKILPGLTYIFGWDAGLGEGPVYLNETRSSVEIGGLSVRSVQHDFDGIPESAFLVSVDGLLIYFSGDFGSVGRELNPKFKNNIDLLASWAPEVDIAFISQFGSRWGAEFNPGDRYTVERLRPRLTIPMHKGGREDFYRRFAAEGKKAGVRTEFFCAGKPGSRRLYSR